MVRISLRLPEELHTRLVERATADRRSLNSEILHLLESTLDNNPPGGGAATPAPLRGRPDSSSA
ncbi:Arc family DNA-binding protein [Actinomadura bangladeshensis]|uniref:Arc family DNA-binding protein n=1 Tax=Actinomadura bangladeshensis TaxID=453573 RepID=A0A6L9Q843_9ACTN|nr:Arc family DNA-binding protein [Actinomadura bangladeshensis]NEA21355.1 Arc family DNA-binding protein [Actinomadura bangladeshensis]